MNILAIETSNKVCSVAIVNEHQILAQSELFVDKRASAMLTPMIADVLKAAGLQKNELSAVAVGMGPGSYTGLRVGISTAKGLCLALDLPLIAVNSLNAMAFTVKSSSLDDSQYLLCPMIDARRLEVYTAIYDFNLNEMSVTEALILNENSFQNQSNIVFFGDGAAKFKALGVQKGHYFLNAEVYPSAKSVGLMAIEKFKKAEFENLVTFEPFYLKEFIGAQA